MPVQDYEDDILQKIGSLIGNVVRIDTNTLDSQRGRFARVGVELDITKPLVPRVKLDGVWQRVEYENLPQVCFRYGRIGHAQEKYSLPAMQMSVTEKFDGSQCPMEMQGTDLEQASRLEEPVEVHRTQSPDFGPWLYAPWRARRAPRKEGNQAIKENKEAIPGIGQGLRFNVLANNKEILVEEVQDFNRKVSAVEGNNNQRKQSNTAGPSRLVKGPVEKQPVQAQGQLTEGSAQVKTKDKMPSMTKAGPTVLHETTTMVNVEPNISTESHWHCLLPSSSRSS